MNRYKLKQYIDYYKQNFDTINQEEIYKWKAVKCFQDNWNIDAENFYDMFLASIKLTQNLLKSGQYFPLRMMMRYSSQRPTEIRNLFRNLFKEEDDIYDRIINFQNGVQEINQELFPGKNTYQDHRAVIVYLTLKYPERYFLYKFEMFKQFSEKLQLIYKPKRGRIENIGHYISQCELIRYELSLDQELINLHKNRINLQCYFDENLNILTQDFIYAVSKYLNQTIVISEQKPSLTHELNCLSTDLSNSSDPINFKGRTLNYIQNSIDNKRIGDLGELWVMKYEIDKLNRANKQYLVNKIKHVSKDEGDGTGYDIQSFDKAGNKIYIEVKTTKGRRNSTFFITRNELERSKIEKANYFLYRLYNYNEAKESADLLIIQGDLTILCEFPIIYKINLTNE
jgi:hypothetical protein